MRDELAALDQVLNEAPVVKEMLSAYGKRIFFSESGVLAQTWEARQKAYAFNATLGEARSQGQTLYSKSLHQLIEGLEPQEVYPYVPPAGLPLLREAWQEKMRRENPRMSQLSLSMPVVTSGLTHGLSLTAELFVDEGDPVVVHDMHWENYELIYEVHAGGRIASYPTFTKKQTFNIEGLEKTIMSQTRSKMLVILNFPNNPTGYMLTPEEAQSVAEALKRCAQAGKRLVVLVDDAYYGFWYADGILQESLFGYLAGLDENILALRLDGATKEAFAGGFRVGFLTYGGKPLGVLNALEKKTAGAVRAYVSSAAHPSQTLLLKGLESQDFLKETAQNKECLVQRGRLVIKACQTGSSKGLWKPYPFRAGYFLSLEVAKDAFQVRRTLLEKYGVGVIAAAPQILRVAVPCLELEELQRLFELLDEAIEQTEP